MSDNEINEIKNALKAHLKEIEAAHSEALASQALFVGLVNAMSRRGLDPAAVEEAFEYAAQVGMIGGAKLGPQATRVLDIVDQLRKAVVTHQAPQNKTNL